MAVLAEYIMRGTRAEQPNTQVSAGSIYCVTDENYIVERYNGTAWETWSTPVQTDIVERYTKGAAWVNGGAALIAADANIVYVQCQQTGLISKVTVFTSGGPGSCVIDVWKDTYANYPPTVGDTITAAAKPTIVAGTTYTDSTLTGWTKTITAGDFLAFKLESSSTFTFISIQVEVTPT